MASINKHGLKIKGLRKACGETSDRGADQGVYYELFYDRSSGEVWTEIQCSIGHNSWTVYHGNAIIKIRNTSRHMTMQEIADAIRDRVAEEDWYARHGY